MNVRVTPFGDSALLLEVDDVRTAHRIAAAIDRARPTGRAPAGIGETVVGMGTVVVHLHDPTEDGDAGPWLQGLAAELDRSEQFDPEPFDDSVAAGGSPPGPRRVDIPVTFDGPDLDEVAERIGATPTRVVELLTNAELEVAFLGFAPGFAYLTGLPPALAAVPRRPTPRVSVPGGSVAVAGGFASIYPSTGPGGWQLIGHTPTRLFDPDRPPHALLRPGDVVRFIDQPPVAIALADPTLTGRPATERARARSGPAGPGPTEPADGPVGPVRGGSRTRPAQPAPRRRAPGRGHPRDTPGRAGRPRHHATGQPVGGQHRRRRGHRDDGVGSPAGVHRPGPPGGAGADPEGRWKSSSTTTRWPPVRCSRSATARWWRWVESTVGSGPTWRCREGSTPRWWSAPGPVTCSRDWVPARWSPVTAWTSAPRVGPTGSC